MAGTHVFKLHECQADVFESSARYKVVAAGRRGGKSDLGALWQLYRAKQCDAARYTHSEHWVVAPTYAQLGTLWSKFFRVAPNGWITSHRGTQDAPGVINVGRSRIVFRSAHKPELLVADALRSLWMDECGVIQAKAWQESLAPTLVDYKAPALFSGTPKGMTWFHDVFTRGQDRGERDWASFRWHSARNPFVEESEIAAIAATFPKLTVDQEIWAIFISGRGDVFRTVGKNIAKAIEIFGGKGFCRHPTRYVGFDVGKQVDFSVLHGLCEHGHTTGWQRFNKESYVRQQARVHAVARAEPEKHGWEEPTVIIDEAGVGMPVADWLEDQGFDVIRVNTASQGKPLIEQYMHVVEDRTVLLADEPELRGEHESFSYYFTPKTRRIGYAAPEGKHDDTVIAAALATHGFIHAGEPIQLRVSEVGAA